MNTVTIIPARGGSKGIPGKNLIEFCGEPLLYWSINQSVNSQRVSNTYVTSDSNEILDFAKSCGATPIKRPVEYSTDTATSESALLHAIEKIKDDVDTIVFLQPTSPLRYLDDIDNALALFEKSKYDSLFSGSTLEDFYLWSRSNGILNSINHDWEKRVRRQDSDDETFVENGSVYIFKSDLLKNTNNRLGGNIGVYLMKLWQSFEIDNLEELEFCDALFKHYLKEQYET